VWAHSNISHTILLNIQQDELCVLFVFVICADLFTRCCQSTHWLHVELQILFVLSDCCQWCVKMNVGL
jgi:hypothetical protein